MYARSLSWAGHFLIFLLRQHRAEAALPVIEEIWGDQLRSSEISTPRYLASLTTESNCPHRV